MIALRLLSAFFFTPGGVLFLLTVMVTAHWQPFTILTSHGRMVYDSESFLGDLFRAVAALVCATFGVGIFGTAATGRDSFDATTGNFLLCALAIAMWIVLARLFAWFCVE